METMIGEKIKNIRKKLGLTQEDLAGENLSRGMISLIERNQTTPTIRTLNHIAPKLGISVSELLEDTYQSDIPLKNEENIILKKVIEMSKALITKKRLDEAQDALSKVYSDLTVFDVSHHGEILKLLGDINFYKENYKTAISYYNEALVYITPHETADYLQIYLNLSESNRHIQDYQTSIESAQYALLVLNSNLRENLNHLLN
ncbi:helix-turn-helix domain-containing protein, partial [Bacillus wiedmannii]|uniref:helix-turn-helix domain-containing protein n=1 Tax=Bacillus wiedmannii TaxID=1890302 RepID=UPI002111DD07